MKTINLIIICLTGLTGFYLLASSIMQETRMAEAIRIQKLDTCMASNWFSYEACYDRIYGK